MKTTPPSHKFLQLFLKERDGWAGKAKSIEPNTSVVKLKLT